MPGAGHCGMVWWKWTDTFHGLNVPTSLLGSERELTLARFESCFLGDFLCRSAIHCDDAGSLLLLSCLYRFVGIYVYDTGLKPRA